MLSKGVIFKLQPPIQCLKFKNLERHVLHIIIAKCNLILYLVDLKVPPWDIWLHGAVVFS